MGVVVEYAIVFNRNDYNIVDRILTQFYERGDIDSVTVDSVSPDGESIRVWIECSTDDFDAVRNELLNHDVEFE